MNSTIATICENFCKEEDEVTSKIKLTSVNNMSRSELVAELNIYQLEIRGNDEDLRHSVRFAREICKEFSEVWDQDEKLCNHPLYSLYETELRLRQILAKKFEDEQYEQERY
jgi:hypothetical protein